MAEERKISNNMDLTIVEAVQERYELKEYRKSEPWTHQVLEKIDRRIADLNNLIAEKVSNEMDD